jgi:hypothetical protein
MLADEMTQDTFIDVVEKASALVEEEAFVPWVRRIAVNHCLGRLRSPWYRRRTVATPIERIAPTTASQHADTWRDLSRARADTGLESGDILVSVADRNVRDAGDAFGRLLSAHGRIPVTVTRWRRTHGRIRAGRNAATTRSTDRDGTWSHAGGSGLPQRVRLVGHGIELLLGRKPLRFRAFEVPDKYGAALQ